MKKSLRLIIYFVGLSVGLFLLSGCVSRYRTLYQYEGKIEAMGDYFEILDRALLRMERGCVCPKSHKKK